jgi:hypothetical protein
MATAHWRKGYSVTQLFVQPDAGWSFHQLAHLLLGMGVAEDAVLETLAQRVQFIGSMARSLPPGEIRQVIAAHDGGEFGRIDHKDKYHNKHIVECAHYNLTGLTVLWPSLFPT